MPDNLGNPVGAYVIAGPSDGEVLPMMPSHVLYEIPTATWPIRLLMGVVCALFVTGIFGWWLPRAVPKLLTLPRASASQTVVNWVLAWAPVVIGFGPLVVLISLIRNPIAYVTDTG